MITANLKNGILGSLLVGLFFFGSLNAADQESGQATVITDLKVIETKLTEMAKIARTRERLFDNIRIKGSLEPKGESFELTIHNEKCRYDREVVTQDGTKLMSYWLDDGENLFSMSQNLLMLDPPLDSGDGFHQHIASYFWIFHEIEWEGKNYRCSGFCEELINLIHKKGIFDGDEHPCTLKLRETETQTEIEISLLFQDTDVVVKRQIFSFDPSKKYVLTRCWEWSPSVNGPDDTLFEKEVISSYKEIAPGVFYISEGVWRQERSGKKLEELDQSNKSEIALSVESVEYGDFEVDEKYFDVHHWPPIKKGMKVDDSRVEPSERYVFEEGTFDDQVLNRVLGVVHHSNETAYQFKKAVRHSNEKEKLFSNWMLIGSSIMLLLGIVVYCFYKQKDSGVK